MISFNNTVTITEGQDMVPLETIQYSQLSKWPKRESVTTVLDKIKRKPALRIPASHRHPYTKDSFVCPTKSSYIFSKINLLNMDTS